MVDFRELIDNIEEEKLIQLMLRLGAHDIIEKEDYLIFPTICHNPVDSEASHKLYYYKNSKMFVCYTECGSMSIFTLLKKYYEVNFIDYVWDKDIIDLVRNLGENQPPIIQQVATNRYRRTHRYNQRKVAITLPEYKEDILSLFHKKYPLVWLKDGITEKAMARFGIRFSTLLNRIIIPHRDKDGRLVGVRSRVLDEEEIELIGKYIPIEVEGKWYSHPLSMNLYGLYENKSFIKKERVVYIFEGEKSVLQLEGFDMPNLGVASAGLNFNKFQFNLLMELNPIEIIFCFDKEELPGSQKFFDQLCALGSQFKNYTKVSFVYDRQNLLRMKESPTDRGEETFRKLLQGRVTIR